jgi:SP family facilitated glucose transporter-like MFS transporter 8
LDQLEQEGILNTDSQQSWFGSLVTVGAILGGPMAGVLVGRLGRKSTIMASCVPFSLGWLVILVGGHFPHEVWLLYGGRILCGIGTGMVSLCVPLYIGEIATKEVRGMLGAGFQLSVTFGILCVYALGLFLPWRYLAVVGSALSALLICLMNIIPETPQYLMSRGDTQSALESLTWLRGPRIDVEIECQAIARSLEANQGSFNLRELSDRGECPFLHC